MISKFCIITFSIGSKNVWNYDTERNEIIVEIGFETLDIFVEVKLECNEIIVEIKTEGYEIIDKN